MESEPMGKNVFLFIPDNETFEWTRDIIKSPYDHDLHNKIVDKANQINYEIYNDFIAYLLNSFINENKRTSLKLEISPYDEDVKIDEKYRDDAISNLSEVFKNGYYKGIDFFKSNRKDYYLKTMTNDKDEFVNDFIADLFNEKYGYYFDDQMEYEEYIRNIPLCFDERTIFNHGFINGVYSSFDQFKYLMPYSIRSKVFDYIESPNTSKKTDNESIKHPFKDDDNTLNLFNYIVDNWYYNKQQKWADIWIELNSSDDYVTPYKSEYRDYIIKRFNYTGKFQFDKVKDPDNQNKQDLIKLITEFSKK